MIPVVAAMLSPLVKDLFANGLTMLGNAVLAKGRTAVEEKLGVKLPDENKPLTPEQLIMMRQLSFNHEEALLEIGIAKAAVALELEKVAGEAVTKRWEADMLSDSWLSKNIRPIALIVAFGTFLVFAVASLFGVDVKPAYTTLLGELLQVMVGAYFVGRTVEKTIDVYQGWKNTKGE